MKNYLLGIGALTWSKSERIDDRYGYVQLVTDNSAGERISDLIFNSDLAASLASRGARGKLVAVVVETRQSTHAGDWWHGVYPETPEVGETIVLSEVGTFDFIPAEGEDEKDNPNANAVGIKPDDGRRHLWLDIKALYRAHEQTVELRFIEE